MLYPQEWKGMSCCLLTCIPLSSPSHSTQISRSDLEPNVWSWERPCDRTSGCHIHLDIDQPLEVNSNTGRHWRHLDCTASWAWPRSAWALHTQDNWSNSKCVEIVIAWLIDCVPLGVVCANILLAFKFVFVLFFAALCDTLWLCLEECTSTQRKCRSILFSCVLTVCVCVCVS